MRKVGLRELKKAALARGAQHSEDLEAHAEAPQARPAREASRRRAGRALTIYAESSAVLGWLLGEPKSDAVRQALVRADAVIASELTLVECDRTLIRAQTVGALQESDVRRRRTSLAETAEHRNHADPAGGRGARSQSLPR